MRAKVGNNFVELIVILYGSEQSSVNPSSIAPTSSALTVNRFLNSFYFLKKNPPEKSHLINQNDRFSNFIQTQDTFFGYR